MARGLSLLALISVAAFATCAAVGAAELPGILVSYSFEEEDLATGPDTFAVFENARGRVELSEEMALSGWASIRLEDAPGDGDFPELQGYFPRRSEGWLYVHFALLVVDPGEEMNAALAGPAGFVLGPDGIAFWLRLIDGELVHVSDSIPRRLVAVRPFVWYAVDLAMDLDAGRHDLTVWEEGLEEPVVGLVDVPNAASLPATAVDKFSFIGDLPDRDRSSAVFFVDDVLVGVDGRILDVPFVAPGRRKLFLERCRERTPGAPCPAPAGPPGEGNPEPGYDALFAAARFDEALAVALERIEAGGLDAPARADWLERAAAASSFLSLRSDAESLLVEAHADAPGRPSILVALSDLAHLRGDYEAERRLREAVYGSLESKD